MFLLWNVGNILQGILLFQIRNFLCFYFLLVSLPGKNTMKWKFAVLCGLKYLLYISSTYTSLA